MAQIDKTRPGEPIPGLADQIIRHTRSYNVQFGHGVDKDDIIGLDTETIYDLCPFGEVIRSHPGYDSWENLRAWQKQLEAEMSVKGKNEWAKRIMNHINGVNEPAKPVPFWKR